MHVRIKVGKGYFSPETIKGNAALPMPSLILCCAKGIAGKGIKEEELQGGGKEDGKDPVRRRSP